MEVVTPEIVSQKGGTPGAETILISKIAIMGLFQKLTNFRTYRYLAGDSRSVETTLEIGSTFRG